jgi:hypothetical protein
MLRGCCWFRRNGGGAGKVELLTGIDGVAARPVRRIVLRAGP